MTPHHPIDSSIPPSPAIPQRLIRSVQSFWSRLIDPIDREYLSHWEPKIRVHRDSDGNESYTIYDPMSGRTYPNMSEDEVRRWLDRPIGTHLNY
ncbi:MAG: hypothetical protein OHK0012_05140 [Synechococcales cyanobacterium]